MADRFSIADLPLALAAKQFPTITTWNRVEGRPTTVDFNRALRAEVRDALWMLTRQWQMGEFNGEDAGSPASMRASIATTRLTRYQPGDAAAQDFNDLSPFETQIERRPVKYSIGADKVALNLRVLLGRRWLRLIQGIGAYADLHREILHRTTQSVAPRGSRRVRARRGDAEFLRGRRSRHGRRRLLSIPDG